MNDCNWSFYSSSCDSAVVRSYIEDDLSSVHIYDVTIQKRCREIEVGSEFSHYKTMVITTIYSDTGRIAI